MLVVELGDWQVLMMSRGLVVVELRLGLELELFEVVVVGNRVEVVVDMVEHVEDKLVVVVDR